MTLPWKKVYDLIYRLDMGNSQEYFFPLLSRWTVVDTFFGSFIDLFGSTDIACVRQHVTRISILMFVKSPPARLLDPYPTAPLCPCYAL